MKPIFFRLTAILAAVGFIFLPVQLVLGATASSQAPSPALAGPSLAASAAPLAAMYNTNLVPDGGAESTPLSTYWIDNEGWTQALPYGQDCGGVCNYPTPYDPGPTQRGNNFFYAGTSSSNTTNGTNMWIKNKISLTAIQAAVNTGKIRYILSGYFGGDTTSTVTSQLHMFFETGGGAGKGDAVVGNVTAADRQNKTGLLYRQVTGYIPVGTQVINLDLQTSNPYGYTYPWHRTAYADNLSLVLLPFQAFIPLTIKAPADQALPHSGFPAPTGVFVTSNGLTRMDIYWTDNSNNELGFLVQRINQDSSVDTICNTKPNVTYCLDPGIKHTSPSGYFYLGSSTTYSYQVQAIGPASNSAWASYSGTTATMPTSAPVPTHGAFTCQAIDTTSTSTTFVWNDPFNYEAGFNIYVGSNLYPSWSMLEGGTKITFINQSPGNSITLKIVPFVYMSDLIHVIESLTTCTITANLQPTQTSGVTKFSNNTSYPVISLIVDGWEQLPVRPLAILSGSYYELTGVPAGSHTWTAITGFWDDWGQRFAMYTYTGSYLQPASGSFTVNIPDMTIQDLLTVPPANLGYWEGYYFDASFNCYTVAFKFLPNGTYNFYNANVLKGSGSYALVQHQPAIFSTKFSVSGYQSAQGLLIETQGESFMSNGPLSWPQITYQFKPQGYVYNPFCP
jgi:hypothetical protein